MYWTERLTKWDSKLNFRLLASALAIRVDIKYSVAHSTGLNAALKGVCIYKSKSKSK